MRIISSCVLAAALVVGGHSSMSGAPWNRAGRHQDRQPAGLSKALAKPRLGFEPNQGQTDPQVRFLSRGPGYRLFLTDAEAVLTLERPSTEQVQQSASFGPRERLPVVRTTTLRMGFVNSDPRRVPVGRRPLRGRSNYFLGNDPRRWLTDVPQYAEVAYQGVYPGVDLVYHDGNGSLEYDFVIAPEGDPAAIRMRFVGGEQFSVNGQGELAFQSEAGELRQGRPTAYQDVGGVRRPVSVAYVVQDSGDVTLETGPYDRQRPLIIDPVLEYSTYLGGQDIDAASGIAVDSSRRAVVCGWTASLDFPTAQAIQPVLSGRADAVVTKFSEDGSELLFSTYLGGLGLEDALGIAVDGHDDVYVIGRTDSLDFPTVNPFQPSFGGGVYDAFVVKLAADGSQLLYASYLGGNQIDYPSGLAVDAEGHAFITGDTRSPDFPVVNAFQDRLRGLRDAFMAKVEPDGSALAISTYFGGNDEDYGVGIATSTDGCLYVTGQTSSVDFPVMKPLQPQYAGGFSDAFIAKFAPSGTTLVYSTYLGGRGLDTGSRIVVHPDGQVTVAGVTGSPDFPIRNALQPQLRGGNIFITKLTADGSDLVYSTYFGGSRNEFPFGLAIDRSGNTYFTGRTSSMDFPVKDAVQPVFGGGDTDAFITKIAATGTELVYSTYLGGSAIDEANGIAIDNAGGVYVSGRTGSNDFPTMKPFQARRAGSWDAFVTKLSER